jgi:hypothetical protein
MKLVEVTAVVVAAEAAALHFTETNVETCEF